MDTLTPGRAPMGAMRHQGGIMRVSRASMAGAPWLVYYLAFFHHQKALQESSLVSTDDYLPQTDLLDP